MDVTVDAEGRLHVAKLTALPEPPSLIDLRKRVLAMLPRVDLPELLLEVMGRVPAFEAAFTSAAGGVSKLADFHMINDRGVGLGAKVVTGTVRDSLHMIDVAFRRDGGPRPEVLVTDTGSYSDVVFGLVHLLGMQYRPALADIPDQKGWRIQDADYGNLSRFARGKIDLEKIKRHWGDILRVVVSIYTGEIRAYDLLRMIQRDGNPTPLGEAIAHYGRIFKTLHISLTLWNTFYMDRALGQLKAEGYPLDEEDLARLSPFVRQHINVIGTYSFAPPDLGPAGVRQLRNPDEPDWEEDIL
ncbi:Tn3 family transposase [Microtetraspora malaysiensis]|uniref:Tn3 family transposase n=1 Tax=Microtetraspora malaysiensis TaxID=161358 RepID=UPI003D8B2548